MSDVKRATKVGRVLKITASDGVTAVEDLKIGEIYQIWFYDAEGYVMPGKLNSSTFSQDRAHEREPGDFMWFEPTRQVPAVTVQAATGGYIRICQRT